MAHYTYANAKENALRGRNKNEGWMMNQNHRLWYNETKDEIQLISRYDNNILATTRNDNTTVISIKNNKCYQSDIRVLDKLYGVFLHSIQNNIGIKIHNRYYVSTAGQKHVYIPDRTVVDYKGCIVSIDKYKERILNPQWNRNYINVSRRIRADVKAIQLLRGDKVEKVNVSKWERAGLLANALYRITYDKQHKIINIILDIQKENKKAHLNGEQYNAIKELIKHSEYTGDFSKLLQKIMNNNKWAIAAQQGATTDELKENIPT